MHLLRIEDENESQWGILKTPLPVIAVESLGFMASEGFDYYLLPYGRKECVSRNLQIRVSSWWTHHFVFNVFSGIVHD